MPRATRSTTYVWTLNNWSEDERRRIDELVDSGSEVRYICYGEEKGEEASTPHLQGYVELFTKKTLVFLKSLPGLERAHFEPRRGSQKQAIDYTRKEGKFFEFGDKCRPGKRSDLDAVKDAIKSGGDFRGIAEDHFSIYLQYRRGLYAYRDLLIEPRSFPTVTHVYWGLTGVGKTRRVFDLAGDEGVYVYAGSNPDTPWFDGYCGHQNVLFDDFRGFVTIKLEFLLRLLDRYPMQVPVKGAFVQWVPRRVYITSNDDPRNWYPGLDTSPLWRRIQRIEHVTDPLYDDIILGSGE